MDRRTAIKNSALVALSGFIDAKSLFGKSQIFENVGTSAFHSFRLGKLALTIVTDGHILMKPVQPNFAPDVSPDTVNKMLEDNFASKSAVDLGINILVIKSADKTILIDTGCGANFGQASGWLTGNLVKAGIAPEEITDVVITHAHPDHIGGISNGNKLIFPNAKVYLSRIEHDFWLSPKPDFSKSKIHDEALKTMVTKVARENITVAKEHLHLFEDGDCLLDCINIKLAPGHTPGHTVFNIFSEGEELFHVADLVHSPILVFEHPEWGFEGDTDFDLAVKSRVKVLKDLSLKRAMVFSYHLPWPGLGHVRTKDRGFEWVQTPFALPD